MKALGGMVAAATLVGMAASAGAQEGVTITSLLGEGYTVVSSFMSPIGPAIFLQKADKLVVCFAEEKRDTPTLKTLYCKPIV